MKKLFKLFIIKKKILSKNIFFYESVIRKTAYLRHLIKISLFGSPLDEYKNIRFKFLELKSKVNFFCKYKKERKINIFLKEKIYKFKNYGHMTFTNKTIEKNSLSILKKIKIKQSPWKKNGTYKFNSINDFKQEFINIFKNGIDDFLKETLKSDYQIFSHELYRTIRKNYNENPEGSQLWHWDGGPTTCINLMICFTPVNSKNGSMRSISWPMSKKIHLFIFKKYRERIKSKSFLNSKKLSRLEERSIKCKLIEDFIKTNKIDYFQPTSNNPGLVYFFKNNLVHSGGFGEEINKERIVSVFHIYPSTKISSVNQKFENIPISNKPYPEI